jgi:hypothetical protein
VVATESGRPKWSDIASWISARIASPFDAWGARASVRSIRSAR